MAAKSRKRNDRAAFPSESMDAYSLRADKLEESLATGTDAKLLEVYFGEETYQELCELARGARQRKERGGPRVLILPGIMGSTIGKSRAFLLPDDVIWLDPIDIAAGSLVDLALSSAQTKHT